MRLSVNQFKKLMKGSHAKIRGDRPLPQKKNNPRVNSKKVIIDGIEFDSTTEGNIYWEFKHDPEIEILELQPHFELLPEIRRTGKIYRAIGFTLDYRILNKGVEEVVDVKSIGTLKANSKSYPMRRKLFLSQNPGLRFREIIFDGKKRIEKVY